jgi:thioester reductase-like protein
MPGYKFLPQRDPDIRYLKIIDRKDTHFEKITLQDVLDEKNSFTAGLKYHSLVDEVRERYMIEKNIYAHISSSKYITHALKTYEDEILYSNVTDWNEIIPYFDQIFPEETALTNQIDQIKKWHLLLQNYFRELPSDISRQDFVLNLGFTREIATEINELIRKLKQIPQVRDIILGFYEKWDTLVK